MDSRAGLRIAYSNQKLVKFVEIGPSIEIVRNC